MGPHLRVFPCIEPCGSRVVALLCKTNRTLWITYPPVAYQGLLDIVSPGKGHVCSERAVSPWYSHRLQSTGRTDHCCYHRLTGCWHKRKRAFQQYHCGGKTRGNIIGNFHGMVLRKER